MTQMSIHERALLVATWRDAEADAEKADAEFSAALLSRHGSAAVYWRYCQDDARSGQDVARARRAYHNAGYRVSQSLNACNAAGINPYHVGGPFILECRAAGLNPFVPGSLAYRVAQGEAEYAA